MIAKNYMVIDNAVTVFQSIPFDGKTEEEKELALKTGFKMQEEMQKDMKRLSSLGWGTVFVDLVSNPKFARGFCAMNDPRVYVECHAVMYKSCTEIAAPDAMARCLGQMGYHEL